MIVLSPVQDSKIRHPERQLLIWTGPMVKDQAVAGAVHRLQTKGLLLNIKPANHFTYIFILIFFSQKLKEEHKAVKVISTSIL
jgi:hypothetical protein